MRIELKPAATLDDGERAALKALTAAVYPPDVVAASPGRAVTWAPAQQSLLIYHRLGWLAFSGRLVVQQPAGPMEFTINRPMVLAGRSAAPTGGVIDLGGPPW